MLSSVEHEKSFITSRLFYEIFGTYRIGKGEND